VIIAIAFSISKYFFPAFRSATAPSSMKSAIVFFCLSVGLVMGSSADKTCTASDETCAATQDDVNLMQVMTKVHKFKNTHKYGPYNTRPALEYFKHWSRGKVEGHVNNIVDRPLAMIKAKNLALGQGHAPRPMLQDHLVYSYLQEHRARHCPEIAQKLNEEKYSLQDSSIAEDDVEHYVLRSPKGSLQYVAKHMDHIIAASPELCPPAIGVLVLNSEDEGQAPTASDAPKPEKVEKGGGPKKPG